MDRKIISLFIKFVANRCTREEIEQVRVLLKEGGHEAEWRYAMDFAEQQTNVEVHGENNYGVYKLDVVKRKDRRWLAAAATIALITISAILFRNTVSQQGRKKEHMASLSNAGPNSNHQWFKLSDGTSVQLNDRSHLSYPQSFAGKSVREVSLQGEAYFDVKHDSGHPFIIHAGNVRITVLGTAFNVKAYSPGESVVVTVSSGKVKVEDTEKTLAFLTSNQQLSWKAVADRQTGPVRVNAEKAVAWKKQDLIMDDITMEEAAMLISQRFGVEVVFEGEAIKKCRFTAAFLNRNSLEQVLAVLEDITGGHLSLNSGIVTIDGPAC